VATAVSAIEVSKREQSESKPSPLGRGWRACEPGEGSLRLPEQFLSSASSRCYTPPVRIPTERVRGLRRSQTEAEKAAWYLLRGRRVGVKFRRQSRIDKWVVDFFCFEHRLAIELDGGVHSQPNQVWKDAAKEDHLRTLGIRVLRVPNRMVLEDPEAFVRKVRQACKKAELPDDAA